MTTIDLREHEAQRTSQHGENGIIAAIFDTIGRRTKVCVDVGAFDLIHLSNVYELWHDEGWRAVLIESHPTHYQNLVSGDDHTRALTLINATVTLDSLSGLLSSANVPPDFDLLSIDIDGPDYHVWKSLSGFRPRVVFIEYNPTIPPHIEAIGKGQNYIGASALAMLNLGNSLGYTLIACTKTNLVFVLDEESGPFANRNDLPTLFDYTCISYVMTSYDGGMFFSNRFVSYPFSLVSREVRGKLVDEDKFYIPDWLPRE